MSEEYRVDLHVKVLDEAVVSRAKRVGLNALVYAPHFTPLDRIERTASEYADDDLDVIPAREIFTGSWANRKHVLALDLDSPIPDFISLSTAVDECVRQNAVILVPHPTFATVSLGESELRTYHHAIDGIELFNPKHLPFHNRRASRLADRLDLPGFASSYAHIGRTVGAAWTAFEAVDGPESLSDALRTGGPRTVTHQRGAARVATTMTELAHLGWENTWTKAKRLLRPDRVPTHPGNRRYRGRFDDGAVY